MKNTNKSELGEAIALARFQLIGKVLELRGQETPLKAALESACALPLVLADGTHRPGGLSHLGGLVV